MRRLLGVTLALAGLASTAGASPTPARTQITNVAYMDDKEGHTTQSPPVTVTVASVCGVTLTPKELRAPGEVGVETPFTFTLTNTGNDTFKFDLTVLPGASDTRVRTERGGYSVPAQGSASVNIWLFSDEPGLKFADLTATCPSGEKDTARAILDNARQPVTISKAVSHEVALPGDTITYTLTVHNPNKAPVRNALVSDTFHSDLTFLSSTPPPERHDGQTYAFVIPLIPAQADASITVKARISSAKDDMRLVNVARANLPQDDPIPSNPVTTLVWDGKLAIEKDADRQTVRVGDRINYTVTVTNVSLNATFSRVRITDTLPRGVQVDQSSIQLNGKSAADLNPDPLVIEVESGELPAQEKAVLTYRVTVLPAAEGAGTLRNVALAEGTPKTDIPGKPRVKTPEVDHLIPVIREGRATLIGRVYLDRNGNRSYDKGMDQPVSGARLMIAGIGSVVTDSQGRYGVADLREGRYGLQLETEDLGGDPHTKGGDFGLRGARLSTVYGLKVEDFPLDPPTATPYASRLTRVYGQTLQLLKTVTPETRQGTGTFTAILSFTSQDTAALNVALQDTLPRGAALTTGQLNATFQLRPGETRTVTYTFQGDLAPESRLTDPQVTATKEIP